VVDLAPAYVSHRLPGRARIRIPSQRDQGAYFARVAKELAGFAAVTDVVVNPLTGSVLVTHRGELEAIVRQARKKGLFDVESLVAHERGLSETLVEEFGSVRRELRDLTDGGLDLEELALLLLLAFAAVQLWRGHILAPAVTLLWYATSLVLLSRAQARRERA
jgi:hypothetical protein